MDYVVDRTKGIIAEYVVQVIVAYIGEGTESSVADDPAVLMVENVAHEGILIIVDLKRVARQDPDQQEKQKVTGGGVQ